MPASTVSKRAEFTGCSKMVALHIWRTERLLQVEGNLLSLIHTARKVFFACLYKPSFLCKCVVRISSGCPQHYKLRMVKPRRSRSFWHYRSVCAERLLSRRWRVCEASRKEVSTLQSEIELLRNTNAELMGSFRKKDCSEREYREYCQKCFTLLDGIVMCVSSVISKRCKKLISDLKRFHKHLCRERTGILGGSSTDGIAQRNKECTASRYPVLSICFDIH